MEQTQPIQDLWQVLEGLLPQGWRSGGAESILNGLDFADAVLTTRDDGFTLTVTVDPDSPLDLQIPGLSEFAITIGEFDDFGFPIDLEYSAGGLSVGTTGVTIAIYLPQTFLLPVDEEDGLVLIGKGTFRINSLGEVKIQLDGGLDLPPCYLGSRSGIAISASSLNLDLSVVESPPEVLQAGFDESFVGLYFKEVRISLPAGFPTLAPEHLLLKKCVIGSGGVSGELQATYSPQWDSSAREYKPGPGVGELFGIPFALKEVDIRVKRNSLVASSLAGEMKLPFFDDWLGVDIGLDQEGGLSVALMGTGSNGLKTLTKDGLLTVTLDSIAFELENGVFTTKLSGKLTPLFGADKGLKWPTFDIKELSIDSKGHVHLDGGWLDLPKQYSLDLYGFKIEISQLGFGTNDNGTRWIGFSGGLKLVEGLQAGASVEGLRITWDPAQPNALPKITLNGAGVELKIPGVLELKGEVSYRELKVGNEEIRRFDGDIHLTLETPEIEIDGTMVIGSAKGPQGRYNFFAIYTDVQLPTGIPLASTGLGIYGFAGLFALQMEPNKKPDEMWFGIDHSKSFYHRGTPGITDLKTKWDPKKGSFALGAGITLGTLSDNGYTFNGKFLLAIVMPGPIILLQGASSFLKKRADGADEGQFRSLAVYDGRAGSLLIGLDAEYKTGKGGELIEIGGSMEAFYAFHDPTAWHLWLGKDEPRELRIRALFGRFVEANAYFMLDAHQLALGAWFGYNNGWNFGPLSVRLEAWAEGNARLSFKPTHFHGDLWIHCLVELNAFGLGLGIALDARIAADLFKPYHLRGEFSVGIKLPWPIKKKIGAKVVLEWGPRLEAPPLPLPLTQAAVEHLKSTVVWPLPRGKYLLPVWDDGGGFLTGKSGSLQPADLGKVPLVPLDARVSLTFGRSVHDEAKVGVVLHSVEPPYEDVGHPGGGVVARVKYVLESLELSRWTGGTWQAVARSPQAAPTPALFGSWMPVPQLPDSGSKPPKPAQTKLLVWSKSPFDFTRTTGSSWEEWVSDALPAYPCVPPLPSTETCFGFADLAPGTLVKSPWTHPGPPAFTLSWDFGPATAVERRLLCFSEETVRRGIHIQSSAPGRAFRIVLAPRTPAPQSVTSVAASPTERVCVDVRGHIAGTAANPWSEDGARFSVRDAGGALLPQARFERWSNGPVGLNAGFRLDVELPCATPWVELLVTHRPPFRIVAFNGSGAAVATHGPVSPGTQVTETIRLEGAGITRLEVHAAGNEKLIHSVCYACVRPAGPSVVGYDPDGHVYGPFYPIGNVIDVNGEEVTEVVLSGDSGLCIERICVTPDPETGQVVRREERIEHIRQQLARWQAQGAVLQPHTTYRLTVRTRLEPTAVANISFSGDMHPEEHAYFRTEGPPGLTRLLPPEGVAKDNFDSGLDDLVRYVEKTDPPTVPPPGEKPILFRPFYRAYDVGVQFNEDYVEQMYRMDGRDLGLYLYDNNNQPVRDPKGRLLILGNQWGTAETVTLSEKDIRWVTQIDSATCLAKKLDPETFPRSSALASTDPGRVLAPDTLHEARLIPLLFHETFRSVSLATPGVLPGWYAEDSGPGGPSRWQAGEVGEPPSRFVEQVSAIGGAGPDRPGTVLLLVDPMQLPAGDPGRPSEWTDYRLSVYVRSAVAGAVGVIVRYQGGGTGYLLSLDARGRRLAKLESGVATTLAEDHFSCQRNRDYLLTFEVVGDSLRAYMDGEPVFELTEGSFAKGRIGLYTCQSPGARFADVRVDDLRKAAPAVYRFQFTTSLFANFFHHLHSYQDEMWPFDLKSEPVPAEAAALSFTPPSESEARAYETLAEKVLGAAARQNPERVEVTRLERTGQAPAFLLRSPEPLDWKRVELEVLRAGRRLAAPVIPGDLKLTDVSFGASKPEEESITLLLREAVDLTRHRIEMWGLPGPIQQVPGDPILLLESFRNDAAIDSFTIVDQGDAGGPSQWLIEGGALLQVSAIRGGSEPELPGTLAVTGDPEGTDYRLTVDLRSDSESTVGVIFRYKDENNFYRLSFDAGRRYRRLVRVAGGFVTILWERAERGFTVGEPFQVVVEAVGARLTGLIDGARIFEIVDATHAQGKVGLYAWNNPFMRCERLEVRRPSLEALALLRDRFGESDLSGWSLAAETTGPLQQTASWETSGGALRLRSLQGQGGSPAYPGAYAVAGEPGWKDVIVRARLRSPGGGAIGVVFRGANLQNYYRFSMSTQPAYRQLVKKVGGQTTVLWRDDQSYKAGGSLELTIVAVGSSLRGYLDGVPMFAVEDGDIPAGRIGLYAWNNVEAWFSSVRVWPADRTFAGWLLDETFESPALDRWSLLGDAGQPEPESWRVEAGELRHHWGPFDWSSTGGGVDGAVYAIAMVGRVVFVGGDFTLAGGLPASRIAAWDGTAWSDLGSGVNGAVRAIAVQNDRVYVGGLFTEAGGIPARNVAVWNRATRAWSAIGNGVNGPVFALALAENLLYVGGQFNRAGTLAVSNIASRDLTGSSWSNLGGGVNSSVLALAVWGPHVYAGGRFTLAGGQPASKVARWDGNSWAAASGLINGPVTAIAFADTELYVAGGFTQAGGVAANRIARWTGSGWSPLADGLSDQVNAIAVAGNQVWVAGRFLEAGGVPANRVARWSRSGRTWAAAAAGPLDGGAQAIVIDEDTVYLGGAFASAHRIAQLPRGGTAHALAGQSLGEAFRLTARLRPAADGAVALVLSWQDPANHDALWLDAERGFRRYIRTSHGVETVLWEDTVRPVAGRAHELMVDTLGEQQIGYLDGVELFRLPAGSGVAGRVGFAARRSPEAGLGELRAALPGWSLYHAFGDEEPLSAGTRVRLRAGGMAGAGETGLVQRSAALAGESGALRLAAQGTTLRIVTPDGQLEHARSFLPHGEFASVAASALRKADGTGLFLFPANAATASGGSHRLRWTWHRARPEAGRPFSQAGDRSSERVMIDLV